MIVRIPREICSAVGVDTLEPYGVTEDRIRHYKFAEVLLDPLPVAKIQKLHTLVTPHAKIRGGGVLIKDIELWLKTVAGKGSAIPRSCEQFASILKAVLRKVPGHRVYRRDTNRGVYFAYYVEDIRYIPEQRNSRDDFIPEYVAVDLVYMELGLRLGKQITFEEADCCLITPEEALLRNGEYVMEDSALRFAYLTSHTRYLSIHDKIGLQFTAIGTATNNLDGNEKRSDSWWSRSSDTIRLDRNGEPARVVVDVQRESDKEDRVREAHVDRWFWARGTEGFNKYHKDLDSEEAEDAPEGNDQDALTEDGQPQAYEIPTHPMIPCFDMRRHMRLRIHEGQLTEYKYDSKLGDKLVLPDDVRALVDMLVSHKGEFKDIIAHKGGGAIILCAGPPGTGKTLTSEVYSEVMSRPLYSVQCSQLGTTPDELEDELLKVFMRSQRWNAILLLDEADVYVTKRGDNLKQNAIVGVFLRVLEYYSGVLFLTTNRAELVDDAIASRCVAKVTYTIPELADQARIWRILCRVMGIEMADTDVAKIVEMHPKCSGRDIKNLLKLAKLVSSATDKKIDADTITFVKRFKPTGE